MEYELSSDFSEAPGFFLRTEPQRNERNESIIIVTKDYKVDYLDQYIVIKSHSPRLIKLYDLPLEDAELDVVYGTSALHIKAMAVNGVHKITAGKHNTINEYQPCYELSSGTSVTLVPIGNTWYSFK